MQKPPIIILLLLCMTFMACKKKKQELECEQLQFTKDDLYGKWTQYGYGALPTYARGYSTYQFVFYKDSFKMEVYCINDTADDCGATTYKLHAKGLWTPSTWGIHLKGIFTDQNYDAITSGCSYRRPFDEEFFTFKCNGEVYIEPPSHSNYIPSRRFYKN